MPFPPSVEGPAVGEWLGVENVNITGSGWVFRCGAGAGGTGSSIYVGFERFLCTRDAPTLFHARVREFRDLTRDLFVLLSGDESVHGRCLQCHASRHITVVDARLTTARTCHLIAALVGPRTEFRFDRLARVVCEWPALPEALSPDLPTLFADAPGPVHAISRGCVSIAGGAIAAYACDVATVARIHRSGGGDDVAGQVLARQACRPHIAGAKTVLLVSQFGEAAVSQVDETVSVCRGVPVAFLAGHIYSLRVGDCVVADLARSQTPSYGSVGDALESKAAYENAVHKIRACAVSDACVRNVKKIAWRPGGRLMSRDMDVCCE